MNEVFEKISKTITDTGKAVGEKTKQVGEVTKLNAKIISSEHTISENYTILGKYYYDNYKDNPDADAEEYVNAITAASDSIEIMKAQILSIKGAIKCKSCGAECPLENNFCGKCGAALEKPEPLAEEDEEAAGEAPAETVEAEVSDVTVDDDED